MGNRADKLKAGFKLLESESPTTQALDDVTLQQAINHIMSDMVNNNYIIPGVERVRRTLRRHGFTIVPLVEVTTKVDP